MIKKNTKIVIEDDAGKSSEWIGGIPLSVGEIIHLYQNKTEAPVDYEVVNKEVNCYIQGADQLVDVTYFLREKK
ncbi:MAG: hypothetical protein A2Y82_03245 [Candidatus Buchananbacteria bacterium RBG_13_36_9]|uniref:Uncharacterized protein n=1 Tax=Candidatus Buchananbacteria bacterium RBG_13_36_9 TaxID=1797530 RepID=A0A1G1XQ49_9BACT|nr:MAG: hypothetical protein A2Y82_03245 [Candidatus Buchananbacteria bacterium RBG_13_36_9]